MKSITLIELIAVICIAAILVGIGYCVWGINDLKMKSNFADEIKNWQAWRNEVTVILNSNLKEGNLKSPTVTPQLKKDGR